MLKKFQMIHGFQIHFICFAETNARIKNDSFVFDSGSSGNIDTFLCFSKHIYEKVIVFCVGFVVHKTAGYIMFGDDTGHVRIIFEPPDIVDQIGTCLDSCICNTSFVSIYRDRYIKTFAKCFDDRNDTCCFFFGTDRSMPRTCGFTADIQNISTVFDHSFCMHQSMIHSIPFATIRKRIRGHVQDAHNISSVFYIKFTISDFHDLRFSF